jgi:hypothetical protein
MIDLIHYRYVYAGENAFSAQPFMRKESNMGKSAVLMIILGMCVPIYADTAVLVYTVSQEANPWLVEANDLNMTVTSIKTGFKMQAALIFAVDVDTLETVVPNDSQAPVLMLIGKDADGSQLNYTLTGAAANVSFVRKTNIGTNRGFVVGNWYFEDPNWFCSTMGNVGAFGSPLINVTTKSGLVAVTVPQILKGIGTIRKNAKGFFFMGGVGDGQTIATLNRNITMQINETGNGTVQAAAALIARKLPPNPNPLTWVVAPRQIIIGSSYYHTMQCCAVDDPNPPILYKFVCVDYSAISSGWQEGTSYQVLVGNTHYYRWYVIAKDGYGNATSKGNAVAIQQ